MERTVLPLFLMILGLGLCLIGKARDSRGRSPVNWLGFGVLVFLSGAALAAYWTIR
jgi:hypothetical protein